MEYSSNGKGNLAVTLGAIGTGLGILNNGTGLLGNLGGNGATTMAEMATLATAVGELTGLTNKCSEDKPVTRYELSMTQALAGKDSEIALLKSEQNTEIKIADVYERIMSRVNQDQRDQAAWNANQSVANAQISAAIATNSASIASLQNTCNNLTKIVIPADNVCPKPMPLLNSWKAPVE